jgi:hypothetical protein
MTDVVPLSLLRLESLTISNIPASEWTAESPAKLVQALLRLGTLKELSVKLPVYDEFVVRFLVVVESGFGNLRTLTSIPPSKGFPTGMSLGAFSLFFIWYKNAYQGRAKQFKVEGLPFEDPPDLLRDAESTFCRRLR